MAQTTLSWPPTHSGWRCPCLLALVWDRYDLGSRPWLRGRMLSLGPVQVHTTTLVSGVLLIIIGLLFLRFTGTAGITGVLGASDTADLEVMLQERITAALAAVPGWVLSGLAAIAAGVWLLRRARLPGEGVSSTQGAGPAAARTPAGAHRR